jgi:tRNA pseudouridine55 synthase
LGVATDPHEAAGPALRGRGAAPLRAAAAVDAALERFRGRYLQVPPAFSAKQVDGARAYALARRAEPPVLQPVEVEVSRLHLERFEAPDAILHVRASAGFYVRVLAHELGEALGCGAHLAALRRVRSGSYSVAEATGLDELELDPEDARARIVPLDALLPDVPAVVVTAEGHRRARHGNLLGPEHVAAQTSPDLVARRPLRVLSPAAGLVALVETGSGWPLHPSLVLD